MDLQKGDKVLVKVVSRFSLWFEVMAVQYRSNDTCVMVGSEDGEFSGIFDVNDGHCTRGTTATKSYFMVQEMQADVPLGIIDIEEEKRPAKRAAGKSGMRLAARPVVKTSGRKSA